MPRAVSDTEAIKNYKKKGFKGTVREVVSVMRDEVGDGRTG